MQRDWQAERLRYLVHFSDGAAGCATTTSRSERATNLGAALSGRGSSQAAASNPTLLGHAWARLVDVAAERAASPR